MAPNPAASRRKLSSTLVTTPPKSTLLVKLKLSPKSLQRFPLFPSTAAGPQNPSPPAISTNTTSSNTPPTSTNGDAAEATADVRSDAANTPDPTSMPPPKKGVKRGADEILKARSRPGPKKRSRREDGVIDPVTGVRREGVSKGVSNPRHNTGAINAGLRALDRSGKPCRRWKKGGLQVKSFTGVTWQLASWKAPPKPVDIKDDAESLPSIGSSKENREGSQVDSEKSHGTPATETNTHSMPNQRVDSPSPIVTAVA